MQNFTLNQQQQQQQQQLFFAQQQQNYSQMMNLKHHPTTIFPEEEMNQMNQMNHTNQIHQTNQMNQMNQMQTELSKMNLNYHFLNFQPMNQMKENSGTRNRFTKEEDERLKEIVEKEKAKSERIDWCSVSDEMKTRTNRQCRERYMNYLNDEKLNESSQRKWTASEDELLFSKFDEFGPRWAFFTKFFVNRTNINIKNRYSCLTRLSTKSTKTIHSDSEIDSHSHSHSNSNSSSPSSSSSSSSSSSPSSSSPSIHTSIIEGEREIETETEEDIYSYSDFEFDTYEEQDEDPRQSEPQQPQQQQQQQQEINNNDNCTNINIGIQEDDGIDEFNLFEYGNSLMNNNDKDNYYDTYNEHDSFFYDIPFGF